MKHAALIVALCAAPVWCAANDADGAVSTAEASVRARLGDTAGAHATVVGRPKSLALPKGEVTFVARPVEGNWPRRRFVVTVDAMVGGRAVRAIPVSFELTTSTAALVYGADLRAHAVVDDSTVKASDADTARVHGSPVVDASVLAGMRLRHSVHAGDVAVMEDFERIPDIDIRQRVRVIASQGAIRLESGGLALASGNRGDIVSVRVDGGDQPVRATVIDRGVTQVVH
jgi:flagella basal body P-ring formation protein FlgA